ncbi:Lysophospholipid acyltransferase 7 [Myotis brandtii]|uniref:Leukocyte receptor cluster member 4 n=1 Tax=Myotis brandtii TaxID=109478 RepID=S7NFM8_MYOBR|nr:Lysophospholipid acyltransferase 7 [Myotis brandtii]
MSPEEWTYLVVLLISIPIGFLFKKAGPGLKRWGAAAVGLGLTLFTCGPHTLHSLITILGTWALIQAQPCSCHALALAWTFSYLLFFRALSLLGLPTPTPFTNAVQLLLTLKVRLPSTLPCARPGLKRWGAAAVGLGLTLFTCGPHTLHSLITILGTWALIQAQPCSCHALALAWTFSYLLFFRALSLLGLPTPTPFTNAVQLLLTLKLVSLASEVQDLHLAQRKEMAAGFSQGPSLGLLPYIPSLMETLSYSYCYVGILTGPFFRYRTYLDWLEPFPFPLPPPPKGTLSQPAVAPVSKEMASLTRWPLAEGTPFLATAGPLPMLLRKPVPLTALLTMGGPPVAGEDVPQKMPATETIQASNISLATTDHLVVKDATSLATAVSEDSEGTALGGFSEYTELGC